MSEMDANMNRGLRSINSRQAALTAFLNKIHHRVTLRNAVRAAWIELYGTQLLLHSSTTDCLNADDGLWIDIRSYHCGSKKVLLWFWLSWNIGAYAWIPGSSHETCASWKVVLGMLFLVIRFRCSRAYIEA